MPTTRIKREQESQGLRAKAPLAAQFEDCLQSLRQLSDALHANRPDSAELEDLARHCSLRLKGWGADSGASSRALDYALRSSSSLMGQTCRLLTDLHLTLAQAIAQVRPQALENDEPGEPSGIPQWEISKISESGAVSNEEEADEDTSMCLDEALDIVACLFQLLPALVDPQHEDDPAELVTKDPSDHSLQLYVDLADKLFPNAPSNLRARLVESTWRARRNLRLLKQRADNQPDLSGAPRSTANLAMPRRIRRPGPRRRGHEQNSVHQRSTLANSEAGTSTARSFSETIMSKTQFPDQSSMSSLTDSQPPTLVQQMIPRLTVPEFKTVLGDNDQFDCPLCYFELPLTMDAANMDQKEWTDHMFHDLQPYLCTFDECSRDNRPFATKDEWFQHELDFHRSQMVWFCGACGDYTDTEDKFRSHLQSMHKAFEPEVLSSIAEGCRRYARTPSNLQECILCQTVLSGLDNLKDHIAAHLEQFSIAASLDLEQSDEDGLEVDDFVDEYVTEQAELHGNTLGPSGTDAQTIQGVEAINHIGTDASRAIDTSDASNNDDMNPATRRQRDDLWNEKVKSFLDKQASVDQVHQTEQCNVPERDEHFFGRQETLRRMHEVMSAPGYVCVVGGRGGIGKTSVALEYLYRHQAAYAYTFWVDAESPGHCAEKYARIASVLDTGNTALPEENSRVYFVRECLTRTERRWLLVFDNVTSWSDIARFIPRNMARSKGSILITTREGPLLAVPHAYHQKTIELEVLSLDSSREFLLISLQPKLTKEELRCHEEFELAAQVVNLVGCLPLAVSILVGYVKVSRCTLADFLEMWEEKESRKKNRKKAVTLDSTGIDPTIDSLWEIGIREVQLNCRRLLDVLSFLDPECIQKSLLVGDHKEQYLEFLNESETVSYGRMIKQLNGRRLITVREAEDGEPLYSIHRMLQQKIQLDMEDYGFADAFRKAFHLIRKRYPRADATQVPDPEAWTVCKKYMPHVYSFHRIYKETPQAADLKEPRPEKVAELFYDAGFHVWARQTTGYDGISFLETADEILNRIGYDPDAKLRADIGTVWGLLLNNLGAGDRAQGMERLKRVKQIREKIWAEDPTLENDIMLRNAANDYSLYLLNQHHFEEAAKIIEECYKQYQVWGPESENPFEYSKYWGNYSVVLMWRGEIDEAIQYVERCIQLTGKFSGKNPQYYRREFLLGCYLLQKGDVQGALDKHMATLTARLELHGQNHEATILSMYAVGAMYHHLGDASTAIEYLKQCIDCEKRAKWTREGLALAKYRLSLLYEEQGIEDEQAKTLKAEARKVLDDCGEYAGICARQSGDEMSILEDLQPTFTGRYTGQALLKTIQHYHSSERIVVDA